MNEAEARGLGEGFVHLRVHSAYSLLEGAIKADAIGKLAHAAGMPAVALTDRANLFGALEFSVATKEAGVQPAVAWARVANHAEGLILLSDGPDGPVDPLFAAGRTAEANAALSRCKASS